MAKVLIVDDSALMRKHLADFLQSSGGFEVLTARNGIEALAALTSFDPDVVTLDINMPEMDGITCLAQIMVTRPKPVVMVSSITEAGAEITLQALSLGAFDFVRKPGGTISLSIDRIHAELLAKICAAASSKVRRSASLRERMASQRKSLADGGENSAQHPSSPRGRAGLILIGVSTGGPGVLEDILPGLPANLPWPVLVAQHMPGSFTCTFARRLDAICRIRVTEVSQQTPLEPGVVYIAKGDADLVVRKRQLGYFATPVPSSNEYFWHPSVERMVASALDTLPADRLIGVELTGMGNDGVDAMVAPSRARRPDHRAGRKHERGLWHARRTHPERRREHRSALAPDRRADHAVAVFGRTKKRIQGEGDPCSCGELRPDDPHPPVLSTDGWIAQFSAPDPALRRRAVRALDSGAKSIDALIAQLGKETAPSVRSAIFNALANAATPRAVESLLLQLRSEDAALRNGAIDALQTLPQLVGPHVERLLADPDPDVRISAVSILSALAHPDIPKWLADVVRRDANVNVCAAAVDALAEAGDEAAVEAIAALPQRFPGVPYIAFAVAAAVRRIKGL